MLTKHQLTGFFSIWFYALGCPSKPPFPCHSSTTTSLLPSSPLLPQHSLLLLNPRNRSFLWASSSPRLLSIFSASTSSYFPRLLQYTCPRNSGRASLVGSSTLQIQAQNQTSPVRTIAAGPSTEVQVTPPTEALEIPPATLLSRSRETTLHLPLPQTFRPTTHNIQLPIHNSPHHPAQALLPPRNPPHHQALPLCLYLSLISAKELLQLQK